MTENIKIGLVEDQLLFRRGIKSMLECYENIKVVCEFGDGFSVLSNFEKNDSLPHILLVDITLPPHQNKEYSGLDLTKDLKKQFPQIGILILSVHDDPYLVSELIECGANGFLNKDSDPDEVFEAIETIYHKGSYINQQTLLAIQTRLGGNLKPDTTASILTKRETEVLKLICQQLTAEEIGEKLFISPKTVNGHRNNLLQKTNSRNVTGLVMYAIKHQLVEIM